MKSLVLTTDCYDSKCRRCTRLANHLDEIREAHPKYQCLPVPPFGSPDAELLIVGLAPGLHGANRTGRPFTGDFAGILLYETLYKFGFASHPGSADPQDGLVLKNCIVTNAVKCLPPANKPMPAEIRHCNAYLASEVRAYSPRAILALGRIAHDAVLLAIGSKPSAHAFGHGNAVSLPMTKETRLFDSYHCSRYNTQTRRLTRDMFESVVSSVKHYLDDTR